MNLFAGRRAADRLAALEDEHLAPSLGEVGRTGEPVVPGTNDDRVIGRGHQGVLLRSGSKKGVSTTVAADRLSLVERGVLELELRAERCVLRLDARQADVALQQR